MFATLAAPFHRYDFFSHSPLLQNMEHDSEFDWGGTKIHVLKAKVEGIQCFFLETGNGMFNTGSVYGRNDDAVRFDFFCKVLAPPPPLFQAFI